MVQSQQAECWCTAGQVPSAAGRSCTAAAGRSTQLEPAARCEGARTAGQSAQVQVHERELV